MTLSDSKGGFRGAGGEAKADQDLSRGGSLVARGGVQGHSAPENFEISSSRKRDFRQIGTYVGKN